MLVICTKRNDAGCRNPSCRLRHSIDLKHYLEMADWAESVEISLKRKGYFIWLCSFIENGTTKLVPYTKKDLV